MLRSPPALHGARVASQGRPGVANSKFARRLVGLFADEAHLEQDSPGTGQDALTEWSERHVACGAREELGAELRLEGEDRARDRGLRTLQANGGVGERSRVDDRREGPQVAELQTHASSV